MPLLAWGFESPSPQTSMTAGFKVLHDSKWEDFCILSQESITIGREGATFIISNDTVSRKHITVFNRKAYFFCLDLNSTNGTKINDISLEPFYPFNLTDGDILILATVPLKFFNLDEAINESVCFVFDEKLNLVEIKKFIRSAQINSFGVRKIQTLDDERFQIECEEDSRVILTSQSEILSPNIYSLTNPGCVRVNEYYISVSGPRGEKQQTSETLLPALISQPQRLNIDRGTVVIEYKHRVGAEDFYRKSDLPRKFSTPSFSHIEIILWGIILVTGLLTIILVLFYAF